MLLVPSRPASDERWCEVCEQSHAPLETPRQSPVDAGLAYLVVVALTIASFTLAFLTWGH